MLLKRNRRDRNSRIIIRERFLWILSLFKKYSLQRASEHIIFLATPNYIQNTQKSIAVSRLYLILILTIHIFPCGLCRGSIHLCWKSRNKTPATEILKQKSRQFIQHFRSLLPVDFLRHFPLFCPLKEHSTICIY